MSLEFLPIDILKIIAKKSEFFKFNQINKYLRKLSIKFDYENNVLYMDKVDSVDKLLLVAKYIRNVYIKSYIGFDVLQSIIKNVNCKITHIKFDKTFDSIIDQNLPFSLKHIMISEKYYGNKHIILHRNHPKINWIEQKGDSVLCNCSRWGEHASWCNALKYKNI